MIKIKKNIIKLHDRFYCEKSYINVFLQYFKNKRRFEKLFFEQTHVLFFPNVIQKSLALTVFPEEVKYQYRTKKQKKIQNLFGFIKKIRREGFLRDTLHFSANVFTNFPIMRSLTNDSKLYYRSNETYRLESFFSNLHMKRLSLDGLELYSTKGPLFTFPQKNKNAKQITDQRDNRITIDDKFTPIVTAYYQILDDLPSSLKTKNKIKFLDILSRFWFVHKHDRKFVILMVFNSRFLSILRKFFFKNTYDVFGKYGNFKNFIQFLNNLLSMWGISFKNMSFIYKRCYSALYVYENRVTTREMELQIARDGENREERKSLRKRIYKKYKQQARWLKIGNRQQLFNKRSFTIKKKFRRFWKKRMLVVLKKIKRLVSSSILNPKVNATVFSELQPLNLRNVVFDPTEIFFDPTLSRESKEVAIRTSFERSVLYSIQKAAFYLQYFNNAESLTNTMHFICKKFRNKLNLVGNLANKSLNLVLQNVLVDILKKTKDIPKTMYSYLPFLVWTNMVKTYSQDFHVQQFFPMNIHKRFLISIKKAGNFGNINFYPKIFKAWHLSFFGKFYPNYKIVIRRYKQLRGSVQINILTEKESNLFSSWPGLVFKKPEKVVGDHQEHKYIYLRFLKRKTAKLDYNAKLLAARHASNFLYNTIRKKPGTIEVIMRRPLDSMTKTLINAVVPVYFWHGPRFYKKKKNKENKVFPTIYELLTPKNEITWSMKSQIFKYIFNLLAMKLKTIRSVCILGSEIQHKGETLISNLKVEIRQLSLFFIMLCNMKRVNIDIWPRIKSLFKVKRKYTFKALKRKLRKKKFHLRKSLYDTILKLFAKKKMNKQDTFISKVQEYNKLELTKFQRLSTVTFSKLGPFVLTKKITVIPELSHGSYEKPRKPRRV